MGQYYYGVMNASFDGQGKPIAFRQTTTGFLKLTEHSWWNNPYVNWFCKRLSEAQFRIGWVGDYSDDQNCPEDIFLAAHGYDDKDEANPKYTEVIQVSESHFTLQDKFLVNHTKKQYLDCKWYYEESLKYAEVYKGIPWVIHPLPILTCIGNGLGGGDYRGDSQDQVGKWFWDVLEVTDQVPAGYDELKVIFTENKKTR